jgi:hypothetical protein
MLIISIFSLPYDLLIVVIVLWVLHISIFYLGAFDAILAPNGANR